MSKILDKKLLLAFQQQESFTREELFKFYRHFEPELPKGTLGWRIYDLKNRNIIKSIKKGVYVISNKQKYKPDISSDISKIIKKLSKNFYDVKYCVWETGWLNEFTRHQTNKSMIIIEIEKGFEETLFYYFIDNNLHKNVFLEPDEKTINLYVTESKKPVVIKKLITRAPLIKNTNNKNNFYTPRLEKILVDIFVEKRLFYNLQGSEMNHIFENALSNYIINFTKLFNYAKRREKEQEIKEFITDNMFHLVKNYLDD